MPQQEYSYYKNKINAGESAPSVIDEARTDYGMITDYSFNIEHIGYYIPFNLEREYVITLIESKKYSEARKHLENMRRTYKNAQEWNFIEIFEYHLRAAEHAEKSVLDAIEQAKKEFNQHTITIVTVVVGVITLLGTANQAFRVKDFTEGLITFLSITAAIIAVIVVAFKLSNRK